MSKKSIKLIELYIPHHYLRNIFKNHLKKLIVFSLIILTDKKSLQNH